MEYKTLYVQDRDAWRRWIDSILKRLDAKREETRMRRLQEVIGLLNAGKKPGLK